MEGKPFAAPKAAPATNVVSLLDALRQSAGVAGKTKSGQKAAAKKKAAAKAVRRTAASGGRRRKQG
jgi:non-homologous end joining protein Ku